MRRSSRRRPAGPERVPTEVLIPEIVDYPLRPILLRLGPGRGLLDYPIRHPVHAVGNVWPVDDGWAEALWPWDPTFGWFVAPIDLRAGHVLEFRGAGGPLVGHVIDAGRANVLVVPAPDRACAAARAARTC